MLAISLLQAALFLCPQFPSVHGLLVEFDMIQTWFSRHSQQQKLPKDQTNLGTTMRDKAYFDKK